LGVTDAPLYSADELEMIRKQLGNIARRLKERTGQIEKLGGATVLGADGLHLSNPQVDTMIVDLETADTNTAEEVM
jgi:hypothetical protein